jgi:hypothetical protein
MQKKKDTAITSVGGERARRSEALDLHPKHADRESESSEKQFPETDPLKA